MSGITRNELIKKYSEKTYLGDGLYVRFDGYHFILITEREDGTHWIGLEPPVFDNFINHRKNVYKDFQELYEREKEAIRNVRSARAFKVHRSESA